MCAVRSKPVQAESSLVIDAPASVIYEILSDYRVGHPAICPKQFFASVTVDKGGHGAGTEITVRMTAMGGKKVYRMIVSEPEPGRVLVEADEAAGVVTTFTVDPIPNESRSRVTIGTVARSSGGIAGVIERLVVPFVMRRMFRQELWLLAESACRTADS